MCENCTRAKRECVWNHEIRIVHDPRSITSPASQVPGTPNVVQDLGSSSIGNNLVNGPATQEVDKPRYRLLAENTRIEPEILANLARDAEGEYLVNVTDCTLSPRNFLAFPLEASLFRFYIEHAGPWLDITAPAQHFASTIPRLSLSNPILMFACLAYSARALLPDSSLSEQYSGACAKLLIPLLSDEGFVGSDETLLATLVILRHVEQYTEASQDQAAHLLGAFSLVALRRDPPPRDSLPGAALWTYMRQDIRQALLNRAPPKLKPSHGIRLNNFDGDHGESSWADRACHLAALACTFAWGGAEGEVDGAYLGQLLDVRTQDTPNHHRKK